MTTLSLNLFNRCCEQIPHKEKNVFSQDLVPTIPVPLENCTPFSTALHRSLISALPCHMCSQDLTKVTYTLFLRSPGLSHVVEYKETVPRKAATPSQPHLTAQVSPSSGLIMKLVLLYHLSLIPAMVREDVQSGLDGSCNTGFVLGLECRVQRAMQGKRATSAKRANLFPSLLFFCGIRN